MILCCIFHQSCKSQAEHKKINFFDIHEYVKSILTDTTNYWKEYPKPPLITNDILIRLEKELKDDSCKFYFDQLGKINFNLKRSYRNVLSYFKSLKNFI